ncbi:hypothetical protein F5Y16DRAFT_51220 [Xylariaceae sp. FL0255]|nr:hypothetical protein F5Y16DRAFT_51220 [Xylariaceae sp. FL0255]
MSTTTSGSMANANHAPPAGRQPRARRKSLEQLETKYKALMRNMLIYQHMRTRNLGGGAAGAGSGTAQKPVQHPVYQTVTPASSVSPPGSTAPNLDDGNIQKQNQQHSHQHQSHNSLTPAQRQQQQRERAPQKRLQLGGNGPKSAYDGATARQQQIRRGPVAAAMQMALDEMASQQNQHEDAKQQPTPPLQQGQPPQPHQYQQQQHQLPPHQVSAPIPIPQQRPANIQTHSQHMPQPYMQPHSHPHLPHLHSHHQNLASPLPTPPPPMNAYIAHPGLQTLSAPYVPYDANGMQPQHRPNMSAFNPNGNMEGDMGLDYYVPNTTDI